MFGRMIARVSVGALTVALTLVGGEFAQATTVSAAPAAARTVYYDASQAGSWASYIPQAVRNWNAKLHNVQLQENAGQATVTLEASSGWPQTLTDQPGSGTVYLGQEAVNEGYDPTRIVAHELGHILGLPDNYNGDCSLLMSGHSAGTSCTNAVPAASEVAQVDQNFAGGLAALSPREPRVYLDAPLAERSAH